MNILIIPSFCGLSNPKNGAQNRISNLVMELKRHNNIIVLESEKFIDIDDHKLAKIYTYKENKIFRRELVTTRDINIYFIFKLIKILRHEKIDLIQTNHPNGIIILKILTLLKKYIPIVYDAHNIESIFVKDVIANNTSFSKFNRIFIPLYIKLLEQISCKYFIDYIISVSDKERLIFHEMYKFDEKKISVIPSGCRINNEQNVDIVHLKEELGIAPDKILIFFHGSFSHPPNKEAFKIIEEYLAPKFESNSNVLFVICGSGVGRFEHKNVKSIGFIENLNAIIQIMDIAIVPLKTGGGTKLKIFDYLSNGLPIITTEKGAEGIDMENCIHALIVDDVDEKFVESVNYLIENAEERKRLGKNACMLAEEKYDWEKIGRVLNKIYSKLITGDLNDKSF